MCGGQFFSFFFHCFTSLSEMSSNNSVWKMFSKKESNKEQGEAVDEPPKDLLQEKTSHPFCRICHETDSENKLLSPCMCLGTMRNVHRKCLEHWLSSSKSSDCDICGFVYKVKPKFPGVFEWLKRNPRPLMIDLVLTVFLTPLAMFSLILCYQGAIVQVEHRNTIESLSLFALGSFLTGVYLAWIALTARAQLKTFRSWRRSHVKLSLVYPSSPISIIVPRRTIRHWTLFRPNPVPRIWASSPQNTDTPAVMSLAPTSAPWIPSQLYP